ncbi:MAG: GatB/YqeY domain-containing protein, partial [bacterium]
LAAVFLTQTLKHFKRKGLPVGKLGDDSIISVFKAYKNNHIVKEAIPVIIENWLNVNARPIEDVTAQYPIVNERELLLIIKKAIDENDLNTYHDGAKKLSTVMGKVMKKIKGRVDGKIVAELTAKHIRK